MGEVEQGRLGEPAMRQVVLSEPLQLIVQSVAEPPIPAPGQALVRVRRVGICGTDLHAFEGLCWLHLSSERN